MAKLKDGLWWSSSTKSFHFHLRRKSPIDGQVHDLKGDTHTALLSEAHHRKEEEADTWRRLQVGLPVQVRLPTLRKLHEDWVARHAESLDPRSLAFVEQRVRLHLVSLADLPIDQIDNDQVEAVRAAYLRGTKLGTDSARSRTGANKIVQTLAVLLGWAVRIGLLPALPFRVKALKQDPRLPRIVWPEQVAPYLAALVPKPLRRPRPAHLKSAGADLRRWDIHDLVLFCLSAGLREGEAVAARWEWVDWRRQLYTVGRSKTRKPREIPLEEGLEDRLRLRWEACERPKEGLIFTDPTGRPHSPQILRHPVARAGKALGVAGMTPHDLRRTFASALDDLGFTKGQISLLMGHANPTTTERYILRRPKPQAEAIHGLSKAYALRVPLVCPEPQETFSNISEISVKIPQSKTS